MITKKRYLELKKRRRELHKSLCNAKYYLKYTKRIMDNSPFTEERMKFNVAKNSYDMQRREYTLITELIRSTRYILKIKPYVIYR